MAEEPTRQPSGVAREKIRVRQIIGHICRGRKVWVMGYTCPKVHYFR